MAEDATVEIVQPATRDAPEESLPRYLVDRLLTNPKITVRGGTEVTRLDGEEALESIAMTR